MRSSYVTSYFFHRLQQLRESLVAKFLYRMATWKWRDGRNDGFGSKTLSNMVFLSFSKGETAWVKIWRCDFITYSSFFYGLSFLILAGDNLKKTPKKRENCIIRDIYLRIILFIMWSFLYACHGKIDWIKNHVVPKHLSIRGVCGTWEKIKNNEFASNR